MSPGRGATVLAWGLFALWAAITVAGEWLGNTHPTSDRGFAFALAGYAIVGALVASRHPANAVGWLLLASALTIAVQVGGENYAAARFPAYVAVAWVSEWTFHVWFYLTVVFLPLVFPTGRLLSRRWRLVWWFDLACAAGGVVVIGLLPGHLEFAGSAVNPLGLKGSAKTLVEALTELSLPTYALAVLLTGLSMVLRFRRSTGVERAQLKWFTYAVVLAVGGLLVSTFGSGIPGRPGEVVNAVGWTLFLISCIVGVPAAAGIAIMRYRLYDIDVVINRTLVYGSLTVALAATYVVSILLLRFVLSPITGQSDLAVAVSTLAVAAAFRPARARIQQLVDRRFYRRKYDAVHTLEAFSSRLRQELDLDAVGADLCMTADHTMQPSHVSLWLRETVPGGLGRMPRMP